MPVLVLPEDVVLVMMAVDVQMRYLACLEVGWSLDGRVFALDYFTIEGSPRETATFDELYQTIVSTERDHPSFGQIGIHAVGVDQGYATDAVKTFIASSRLKRPDIMWRATRGEAGGIGLPAILDQRGRYGHPRSSRDPVPLNTDSLKVELLENLQLEPPARGSWTFSRSLAENRQFFDGLTSEERQPKFNTEGIETGHAWLKTAERNEPFDLGVICLAMWREYHDKALFELLVGLYGDRDKAWRVWIEAYPSSRRFS